ncbi:hypothetical protein EK21DRAFT_118544 [Setomelanomma holmii]|uniref:RING-type domain-containing protein n=1 Tax=Setomelanomma holmii TaxID=210430 RepID=A0A9P4LFW7_9PLEO|nr:hypothetical protein EK21DRAFT_118544 [Setomelanomma holmii]
MDHATHFRPYQEHPFAALYPQAAERRNRIYVNFSVEVRQEELSTPYRPVPVLPVHRSEYDQQLAVQDTPEILSTQIPSASPFGEAAQHAVAHFETRGNHTTHLSRLPPWDRSVFSMRSATRLIWTDVQGLLSLGLRLLATEKLKTHAEAVTSENVAFGMSAEAWMEQVSSLKEFDAPLFHMLRDSINTHTPDHILLRWEVLRRKMSTNGQTFENVIRHSEELVRSQWCAIARELYFLLLDHNEALLASVPTLLLEAETLERSLSAYCAALRIRFYLWRMTRSNPMCSLRKYKHELKSEYFRAYSRQLAALIAQEFTRVRDPDMNQLDDVRRELVDMPIEVDAISMQLTGTTSKFCTICQDTHATSDCVSPLKCACILGRECLQALLNRDAPSSYTCPNCRAQLHEPLRWKPVDVNSERDLTIGLLFALRTNIASLCREIAEEPESFSRKQRVTFYTTRLLYGR